MENKYKSLCKTHKLKVFIQQQEKCLAVEKCRRVVGNPIGNIVIKMEGNPDVVGYV